MVMRVGHGCSTLRVDVSGCSSQARVAQAGLSAHDVMMQPFEDSAEIDGATYSILEKR
jgi:hypothetical protein